MRKLMLLAMVAIGLLLISGCEDQTSKVAFLPIPKVQTGGNYTTNSKDDKATIDCQYQNLQKMVGITFTAYPNPNPNSILNSYRPFVDPIQNPNGWAGKGLFSVRSPEKFTITSVQDTGLRQFRINLKFESGKIAYMEIGQGAWLGTNKYEGVIPEFSRCLKLIYDASVQ